MNACPPLPGATWRTATLQDEARATRAELERALEGASWPWALRVSLWLDHLVVLIEAIAPAPTDSPTPDLGVQR